MNASRSPEFHVSTCRFTQSTRLLATTRLYADDGVIHTPARGGIRDIRAAGYRRQRDDRLRPRGLRQRCVEGAPASALGRVRLEGGGAGALALGEGGGCRRE